MTVIMKGGTSGMRSGDFLAPVPDSGSAQPIQRTENNTIAGNYQFTQTTGNREADATPPMPTGGGMATGSDLEQPDISGPGVGSSPGLSEIMRTMPK